MFRFGQDIAASLKSNTAITDLNLSENEFGDKMAEAWALPSAGSTHGGPPHLAGPKHGTSKCLSFADFKDTWSWVCVQSCLELR